MTFLVIPSGNAVVDESNCVVERFLPKLLHRDVGTTIPNDEIYNGAERRRNRRNIVKVLEWKFSFIE